MKKRRVEKKDELISLIQRGFAKVGKRFEDVDKNFAKVEARFIKSDKRFEKLEQDNTKQFKSIDIHFENLENKMNRSFEVAAKEIFILKDDLENFKDETRNNFSNLQKSIDAYAKKADTYFQEMVMLAHKVDRIEKWVLQLADKAGIKLAFD